MASDTATLDLERVHEQRRRLEAERDGSAAGDRAPLGPDDRAPADELYVDTDPATRAAQIVQEVLAAAERRRDPHAAVEVPRPEAGSAADRARRIVEEVLAAAAEATDADRGGATTDVDAEPLELPTVRADLVLLTAADPLVLIPGEAFDPEDGAYVPAAERRPLAGLVDEVVGSLVIEAPAAPDELTTPTSITEAIRGAGESSNRHGVRWIVAGAVWAMAFGLLGPLTFKAMVASADMTIELWEGGEPVAEQEVVVPEDELPLETGPGELQPAEAELAG